MIYFVKTKSHVPQSDIEQMRQQFVPDNDLQEFPKINPEKDRIFPVAVTSFPGVLKRMTAMQAGSWALAKCRQQGWGAEDYECCLSNLEMDF